MPQAIHISPIDNVVVALHPIAKGTLVEVDGLAVTALEDIPQGHKMAVKPIKNGENVIKYGFPIGHATADAEPGTWMHTHNVHTNLSGEVEYSYHPAPDLAPLPKVEPETFMGFRRKDGRAAIRNEIWIIPTVGCVNDIAKKMVNDNQDLVTGSIEGLYTFTHPFGCSQTGHDHAQTRKLLAALVRHPNAAAVLVLHLGCENLQHDQFVEELGEYDHDRVKFLTCQDVDDEFTAAREILKELAAYAGQFKREPIPVSELVVGMKCGGSDGLSGITANPTIGRFSDMMGQRGGSTVLTEVPEMFGAEGFLMDRCINHDVFVKAEHMINGFKEYFISHNEVVYDNPSPGNKQGGITTLEDKSCGCVQKGGSATLFGASIEWLNLAGVVLKCQRISQAFEPIAVYADLSAFKLYMGDVGLLTMKSGISQQTVLSGEGNTFMGAVTENYVAQQLAAQGYDLYYWESSSTAELDFVLQKGNQIIGIEVKKGEHVRSRSLGVFVNSYKPAYSIRFSLKNFGEKDGLRSVPLYAVFCV